MNGVTYIVWGRGSVGSALRECNGVERLGACDGADYEQVADHLVAAGIAERQRGGGVVMLTSAVDPWCCVTIGDVAQSDLDADPAVIGYQTANEREDENESENENEYDALDASYTELALSGLLISRKGGYTLVEDQATDHWLTDDQELVCSPTTSNDEASERQAQIAEYDGSEAYTDLCDNTTVRASTDGGQCDEDVVLAALRAGLFDGQDARRWWDAGETVSCGCESCGEEVYVLGDEAIDDAGEVVEGWARDESVWLCGSCQSYSVDDNGTCICESCDAPGDIAWGSIQTGQSGVSNWQEGVDGEGTRWGRHECGGGAWTAPKPIFEVEEEEDGQ